MKYLTSITLLLLSISIFAQKDPAAEPYLEKIKKDLEPGHALNIEFDYLRDDQQTGSTMEGKGSLFLLDEKYKIDLGEALILFDGEKQYSVNLEIEETYISIPDSEDKEFMFADPIRLLKDYKEEFKYRFMGENDFMGREMHEIQLYPAELGGPYALIKLFISPSNNKLQGIVIRHKEGVLYTMIVTEWSNEESPEIEFFQFKQEDNPNFDIIELVN